MNAALTPTASPPPAWRSQARTPGDIRRPYLEALDRWEEASRRHHVASVGVASGSMTTEQLAEAKLAELEALGDVEAAKNDMAEVLFAQLRVIQADPHLTYGLLLRLLEVMRPALSPVADRLFDLEGRVENLEVLAARRGGRK
jgi:hypothetical protein